MILLNKMKKFLGTFFLILFVVIILLLGVRGLPGNPTPAQLNSTMWQDNGPFELSPERGRFALLYSLVENHSFQLTPQLGKFTAPDVGYINNSYVSIFAPSVSLLAIPGYLIGKYFGFAQVGAFAWISLFALFNVLLIRSIAIRLGAHPGAAAIGGLTFLLATPALPYAVTIYEHHASTFLMLLSIYLLIRFNNVFSVISIWFLYAFAFTVDYPNLFMMLPIAVAAFFKSFQFENIRNKINVRISFVKVFAVLAVILPLAFLLYVNLLSYHNPLTISGSVPSVESVAKNGKPVFQYELEQKQLKKLSTPVNTPPPSALTFFNPRNMINGFYILLFSPDRGVIMFTPVMLIGIVGIFFAYTKKQKYLPVLIGIIGFDFILYSMWGDPYGGWAFGGRYLIPAYAILSLYIALFLTYFGRKRLLLLLFFILFSYSVMVNTLGAITSNSNPPKVQAVALANQIHQPVEYTYVRNVNDLNKNIVKSFVFQTIGKKFVSAWDYYTYVALFTLTVSSLFMMTYYIAAKKQYKRGGTHVS
jgi:hypothetical protein